MIKFVEATGNKKLYQIKQKGKWIYVKATSMQSISAFVKQGLATDWRVAGMLSRAEQDEVNRTALEID